MARAKRLTLVRHAKSDWGDASLDDFDRPLNGRGQRDAPEMAGRLLAAGLKPTLIVTSPALRAVTTARIFADVFGYPPRRIIEAPDAYLATPEGLLEVVRRSGGRATHLMLFGHNPGISGFAARLAKDGLSPDMPTCAVASLLVPAPSWAQLGFHAGERDHYDYPKSRP